VRRCQCVTLDHKDLTPSLFDELPETSKDALVTDVSKEIGNNVEELDDWDEVPQARFLSWSRGMQLHYCWRRDLDAALRAANDNEATFFLERAAMYQRELEVENTYGPNHRADGSTA
jgi:hypothetical protein